MSLEEMSDRLEIQALFARYAIAIEMQIVARDGR